MFKSIIKVAWRVFCRQKYYSIINIIGLSLSISCAFILYLFVNFHLSFDTYHANANRLYRAVADLHLPDGSIEYELGTPYVLNELFKEVPGIENQTILLDKRSFTVSIPQADKSSRNLFYEFENVAFADSQWFQMFTYDWKTGNPKTAINEPYTAVITRSLAEKYFNTEDVIGETIMLDSEHLITITGVLEDNRINSDIRVNMYLSMASVRGMYPEAKEFWTDIGFISSKNHVYALLRNGADEQIVNQQIRKVTEKPLEAYDGAYEFHLQPLQDVHFNSKYGGSISKTLLKILALLALAIICIASANFVNMATAQSFTRVKEIGIKRALGSNRVIIFWQFIFETAFIIAISILIAIGTTFLFLPTLRLWLQQPLFMNRDVIKFAIILFLAVTFLAGFYPAVILSRFTPLNAIKKVLFKSGKSFVFSRNTLIILQNVVAQLLIFSVLVMSLQMSFIKNIDLGFNKDAIILIPMPGNAPTDLTYLGNKISNTAGVKNISFCYRAPASTSSKGGFVRLDDKPMEKFAVKSIIGDQSYLKTFGLDLVAGRDLGVSDSNAHNYLVNETLITKLGLKSPDQAIGHSLTHYDFSDKPGVIVGVVRSFHMSSLYNSFEPAVIASQPEWYQYAAVKLQPLNQKQALKSLSASWSKIFPESVFEYHFLDEQIEGFYRNDEILHKLIKTGTAIAILISCLGMLGLISIIIVQRTKEVGIRKVLGATSISIFALLSKDFIKLIIIAIVISIPIGWWVMESWLQDFSYRISINWWVFAIAICASFLIALTTVSLKVFRAASASPVKSICNQC